MLPEGHSFLRGLASAASVGKRDRSRSIGARYE